MCGIIGGSFVVNENGEILDRSEEEFSLHLERSISMLKHRGPDGSGSLLRPSFGIFLGHTRLAIQDLSSSGAQPMSSSDSSVVVTFNGEIYNFPKLKDDLKSAGYAFSSNCDTEVILNLYREYGIECFGMLDGIFAIGLFDQKTKQLITARDGLGVKPLYVYNSAGTFVFSSEIKAMESLIPDTHLRLHAESIDRYLTFQWCPGEGTPYTEITKHPPGVAYVISDGEIVEKNIFYKPPIYRQFTKVRPALKAIISGLDMNLRKAVHDQMLSDAPVGAFLSGGLDSTSVVAFAKEIDPNITCFTIDASSDAEGLGDDLPYARAAAKHLDVPLEVIKVDSDGLVKNLEEMIWMLDEPLGDPAPLNVLYISQLARARGIKVLLSGAGGDDIFTGYRRHYATTLDSDLQRMPKRLLQGAEWLCNNLDKRVPVFRRAAKLLDGSTLSGDSRLINYFKWASRERLLELYTDDFKAEVQKSLAEQPMLDFLANATDEASNLDKILSLEQRFFTTDHNLLYTDKMSMAVGVEVRVPLLANNLVEYAAAIPDDLKQRGRHGKWIFKKTMEHYLPKEIIYRPKTGFGAPLRTWLRGELRDYMEDLLSESSLSSRGLFDVGAVRALIGDNHVGKTDASYTLFSLMCIEIWCRQHIDFFGNEERFSGVTKDGSLSSRFLKKAGADKTQFPAKQA